MNKNVFARVGAVMLAAASALIAGAAQGQAVPGGPSGVRWIDNYIDQDCLLDGATESQCATTMTTEVGPAIPVTPIEAASLGLRSAIGTSAAATTPLYKETWSMKQISILWAETQTGVFYFDTHQVWVKKYRGYAGNHDCDNGYAAGGSITILTCTAPAGPATGLDITDKYKASGIASGSPFSRTHWMTVHPNGNGTITRTHS